MNIRFVDASRRLVAGLGLVVVLVYVAWIGGPYFRSVIVRDAAVTTWISVAPAPVSGYTTDVLDRASWRPKAAGLGVFMLDDGTDTGTALRSLDGARLSRAQAEATLEGDEAAVEAARKVLDAARTTHAKQRSRDVRAPPGTLVWSMMSAPGAAVQAGAPIGSSRW
jgi:hypothetical protein